jgi:hypothetical protein
MLKLTKTNAQDTRVIIVVLQVGAVKIYVAAVEALRKKERQDETQFTTKIDVFLSLTPPLPTLNADILFCCRFFLNLTLCMTKLRVLVLCFPYFTDNFNGPDFVHNCSFPSNKHVHVIRKVVLQ